MIELGEKVKDIVSGVEGIAVARVEYLNGCIQYCVAPKGGIDALKTDSLYIDEGQLKIIGKGIRVDIAKAAGGPQRTPKGQGR